MNSDQPNPGGSEREQALERLKKRRDFQGHLAAFIVVNAGFWAIWLATGGYPWPAWVTGLGSVGLLLNAWDVYLRSPITEADVQHEMDRLRHTG